MCRRRALGLLARREHSRLELENKLADRSFGAEFICSTLDQLQEEGLLVETRFVEEFIRSRVFKRNGPIRIRAELLERGIGEHEVRSALAVAGFDWSGLAGAARTKRFGINAPGDLKERVRQIRFLRYRGFEMAQINAALDLDGNSD